MYSRQTNNSNNDSSMDPRGYEPVESNIPEKLKSYINNSNIADSLTEEQLQKISNKCFEGYEEDKQSQIQWLSNVEDAQKLAKLSKEPKNTPLPQSANIKFPLITNACYQFAARTYPELIQDGKVVKCEVIGNDLDGSLSDKAFRISTHMSYQLLGPDNEWESSMDTLLTVLPNIGFLCKKTYYDSVKKKNSSLVCYYKDLVIRNEPDIQCLDDLRRITHDLYYHLNDLVESARYGIFKKDVVEDIVNRNIANNTDKAIKLHEQHRYLDLDEDGYEEPYIVTTEDTTNKVLRIVARYEEDDIEVSDSGKVKCIKPIQYFTDYHFLRSTDGSFMSVGFGTLMLHLNETVNTILNQLIDAGTLANLQTGIMDSRIKLMGGQTQVDPGTWVRAKGVIGQTLKDGIFPLNYKEPSATLFQLLGMLIEAGKELSSSTEVMSGQANPQNVPATTIMALVEQGMKVFNGIQRRMYSSLKGEYQKIFRLNKMYLDPSEEASVLGVHISQDDYKTQSIRVIPIADPNLSSDAQRMAKVQFLMNLMNQPATGQYLNIPECLKRAFIAVNMPNPGPLIKNTPPPPDPKMMAVQVHAQKAQSDAQIKGRQQDLKEKQFVSDLSKIQAEIEKLQAQSVELVSKAHKNMKDADANQFNAHVSALKTQMDAVAKAHQQMSDNSRQHAQMMMEQQQQQLDNQHKVIDQHQEYTGLAQNQQDLDQQGQQMKEQQQSEQQAPEGGGENAS